MIALFGSANDLDISFLKALPSHAHVTYGLCKAYFYSGSETLTSLNMRKSKFERNTTETFSMLATRRRMYNGCLIKKSFKRHEQYNTECIATTVVMMQ